MRKALLAIPITALLLASVLAITFAISLRGTGGTVDSIGTDSSFLWSLTKFSAYVQDTSAGIGQASVQIRALTTSGIPVALSGSYKNAVILQNDANTLQVFLGDGRVTYWKKGSSPVSGTGNLVYIYNKVTKTTTVSGVGVANFLVNNIATTEH